MIKRIRKQINLKEFIKQIRKEGISVDKTKKYNEKVKKLCNNACAYLYTKLIDKFNYNDLKKLEIHTGIFKINNQEHQHTWIEYKRNNKDYVIDITLCQFDKEIENIYIEEKDKRFKTIKSLNFTNFQDVVNFFEKI